MLRLVLITDGATLAGRGGVVAACAQLVADLSAAERDQLAVQLRDRVSPAALVLAQARALVDLGVRVLVSDRVDLAAAAGPDVGVHLPEAGLSVAEARVLAACWPGPRWIGASRHGAEAVRAAAEAGADLVHLGPIWPTPSKLAYGPPLGLAPLRAARALLDQLPAARRPRLVAVGGIDGRERAQVARAAGADAVAVIRAPWAAADPASAVRALL
ncbi:MAG: thiamine phosphate synthase [Kofleriaceae bacterium]|nr:thiamine phosphate synthase [Kofleriaceae bacterium]MBP6837484.1 thiamine phosphate synthase [Kofleriaceae bacterium]MBP9206848.1 thiamine phosphate synthase [Kofleriaceae bacterium]